ncbi:hypothetical protein C4J97_0422 [Pseudomonas orientalis]|nr:hypothetical protein C4J97_0422 [Pseudomonas orientalis]
MRRAFCLSGQFVADLKALQNKCGRGLAPDGGGSVNESGD